LSGKRGLHIAQGCHVLALGHKAVELGHFLGIHLRHSLSLIIGVL
jgi:hypothetical protein